MHKYVFLLLFLSFVGLTPKALAQDRIFDTLIARFDRSMTSAPSEKIYIQISKDIYETGEDLWFKGYILDAQSLQLSARSQILYLQMFATDSVDLQKPVWQEKYLIKNGTAVGHIFIPNDLGEGNYFIEAYTSNSFTADSTPITSLRKIRIVKDITKTMLPTTHPENSLSITRRDSTRLMLNLIGQDKDFLEFSIVNNSHRTNKQAVYLFGQTRGMVCCIARAMLKDSIKIQVPLSEFPSQGIAEFTLYDSELNPIDEYEVYVHSQKQLTITATLDHQSYETRDKATLRIKVTDPTGIAVANANLGISVFDRIYSNQADTTNIVNYSYHSKNHKNYGKPFINDKITGLLSFKNKKFQNTEQFIQLSDAEDHAQLMLVDTTGRFSINVDLLKSLSPGYLYLKPMVEPELRPKITLNDQFEQINQARKIKSIHYPFVSDTTLEKQEDLFRVPYNIAHDSAIIVENITIKSKLGRPTRDKYMGKLNALAQKNLGPWVCEDGHLENYLEGYTVHHDPAYCPCPNEPKEKNPPVEGKTYRLIKPKYFANPRVRGGWVFIVEDVRTIVYHGPYYTDEQLLEMNHLWRTKNFYGVRDFYQPSQEEMQSAAPDFRNTLLWSPNVQTDKNGEAVLEFYCSDINTMFTVRIEGIGGDGLLGTSALNFRVKRLPPQTTK